MNPNDAARPQLQNLPKTVHGGQAWKLNGIEDYSHNLNPFGPPDVIREIMSDAFDNVGHYPDDNCTQLKETIASVFKVNTDNIIIGSGSSDIIRMFPNTFINPGDKVILSRPSFAEYTHQCRVVGASIKENLLTPDNDFRIDYGKLSELADGSKAVYICNPNNPTGRIEPREKILSFVEECEKKNTMVFLDETLLELVPDYDRISCVKYVNEYSNLLVAGSLTKSFAIPGIRIGFGFGCRDIIDQLNKVRMTWNVGQVEQDVANVLIGEHMDYVHKAAKTMSDESKWMFSEISGLGFPLTPSDSYFYFNSVESLGTNGAGFVKEMLKNGIMVRDCASFGAPFDRYVRFCVKDHERNVRFMDAFKKAFESLRC